jgi:hypothetical protein
MYNGTNCLILFSKGSSASFSFSILTSSTQKISYVVALRKDWRYRTVHNLRHRWELVVKGETKKGKERKVVASMAMFISLEIWKGRNARVFWYLAVIVIAGIKEEAKVWYTTSPRVIFLSNVTREEWVLLTVLELVLGNYSKTFL